MADPQLTASYRSRDTEKAFESSLPSLPSEAAKQDVEAKTAYISALRSSVTEIQSNVNAFLTQAMEDEKATQPASSRKAKEEREEELYGEEDPEDET